MLKLMLHERTPFAPISLSPDGDTRSPMQLMPALIMRQLRRDYEEALITLVERCTAGEPTAKISAEDLWREIKGDH